MEFDPPVYMVGNGDSARYIPMPYKLDTPMAISAGLTPVAGLFPIDKVPTDEGMVAAMEAISNYRGSKRDLKQKLKRLFS